jgi:hypothetical protein
MPCESVLPLDSASKDVKNSSLLSDTLEEQEYMTETLQKMDENSAHELTRYIVNKLDNNEKETLDEDINLDEISKVIKILKPKKS